MTIEKSHGKARPTLPRSSDLIEGTVPQRQPDRDARGRLLPGNQAAVNRSAKQAIAKTLGLRENHDDVATVARDAARVMSYVVGDMPSDAPTVRNLVALLARHSAIAAYYNCKADELGLDSDEGQQALDRALKHGMRAERLTVTALDVARALAPKGPRPGRASDPVWMDAPSEPATETAADPPDPDPGPLDVVDAPTPDPDR